jgi:putative flippase GtrA
MFQVRRVRVDRSVVRYLIVGVGNSVVGLCTIFGLKVVGFNDVFSNLTGYAVGLLLSFLLNRNWTFSDRMAHKASFLKFLFVTALAYSANLLVVLFSINIMGINGYLGQSAGLPVYTALSYLGCRWFVFSSPVNDEV